MNNASTEQRKPLVLRFASSGAASEFVEEMAKMSRDARLIMLEALRDDTVPASNRWQESKIEDQHVPVARENLSSADEIRLIVKRLGWCGEDVQHLSTLLAERIEKHLNG